MHVGGSLQILHMRVQRGMQRRGTNNLEGLLGEYIKVSVIHIGGPMSTLEVIALRIWTLEVANANGGAKREANVIGDIGGLGLVQTWPS